MLKYTGNSIARVLTNMFNTSLKLAAFPTLWKTGLITPVYKKGCKFDMNNYRPISILSVISRIFERLLCRQLSAYLEDCDILSPMQHGFRAGRSCQTALISLTNRLFSNRGNGYYSAIASLDFSKAFDCISHELLINKLNDIGVSSNCLAWFRSYLNDRLQRVKYNNTISDSLAVNVGIPQGSSFGPQLFNVYINDLLRSLPTDGCIAYADDLTLIGKGSLPDESRNSLQSLLDIVTAWSLNNSLSLNVSKCSCMLISAKLRSKLPVFTQPVVIDKEQLTVVRQMIILGVTITDDLSWTPQADKVRAKMNGRLGVLKRFGQLINYNTRKQLFNAFIKPVLTYCMPVWGNCPVSCQHAFDKTLVRCARYILSDNNAELSKQVFSDTSICPFNYLVFIANATCVYRIVNSAPLYDFSSFILLSTVSQRLSRAIESKKLILPKLCHKADNLCFLYAGSSIWNSLSNTTNVIDNY